MKKNEIELQIKQDSDYSRKSFLNKWIRAKKFRAISEQPILTAAIGLKHIGSLMWNNKKRITAIMVTTVFLILYGSFCVPTWSSLGVPMEVQASQMPNSVTGNNASGDSSGSQAPPDAEEDDQDWDDSQEEELDPEEEDSLEDYEGEATKNLQNVDKYNLDQILDSNKKETNSSIKNTPQLVNGSFSKEDWRLILVNKQHPIPEDYRFNLGNIKGNMRCDERIINDLLDMMEAAKKDGVNLVICSPYRDMERQEMLFARKIKRYMKEGMSYMEAYKISSQTVTVPGASEHQIGLALDIVSDGYSALDEGFGETEAGKWLAKHSSEYGFILRYPEGKEYITGISYEPWHFRYVGLDAAPVITQAGITLEEFWEDL